MKRYEWRVLPHSMANSPTLCQKYVSASLYPVRQKWTNMYIVHYMDDILIAGENGQLVLQCFQDLKEQLSAHGLKICPGKDPANRPIYLLRISTLWSKNPNPKTSIQT